MGWYVWPAWAKSFQLHHTLYSVLHIYYRNILTEMIPQSERNTQYILEYGEIFERTLNQLKV